MTPASSSPAPAVPAPSVWRSFVRGSLGTGVGVAARAAGALTINKLFAVYAPAGGLTLLGQFQNLMALLTALPSDGVHVGLVKYLAPLQAGSGRYRAWFGAAIALNLAALFLGAAVLLGRGLPGWGWGSLGLFVVGIGMVIGQGLLGAALLAAGRLRTYIGLSVMLAVVGTAATAAALLRHSSVNTALLAYLLGQGCTLLPAWGLAFRAGLLRRVRLTAPVSGVALRLLGRFLLMAVSTLLFGMAVNFVLRDYLLRTFGPARTDLWQAVVRISDNYSMVFSAVINSVFYPRLAALVGQRPASRAYMWGIFRLLAPVLALGLGLIYSCRDWLLPLLFAPRLLAARELMAPQLIGDWAKFLSWIFILQLSAKARIGSYIAVQAASAVVFVGLLVFMVPRLGLQGAVLAHAARYGLLLVAAALVFWKKG